MDDKKKSVIEPAKCPGSADIRRPKPVYQKCPNCGREVEMWTDEVKAVCESCSQTVFRDDTPSCFEWCEHAEACIGSEKYRELIAYKKKADGGGVNPTDVLKEEHRLIERNLSLLEDALKRIEASGVVDFEFLEKSVDFTRNFADNFHHKKEEDLLFRLLEEKGVHGKDSPVSVMLKEHDDGRRFVRNLMEACEGYRKGDAGATKKITENIRGYVSLLRNHIPKEDDIPYPMAEGALSQKEKEGLMNAFKDAEKKLGEDTKRSAYSHLNRLSDNCWGFCVFKR